MKRIFSIFVATLLLSTTLLAQNVAKVGETPYDDIKTAIAAWQDTGGTLQLLANCTYETDAALLVTKESDLDLNDFTLTWNCSNKYQAIDAQASFGVYGGDKSKGTVIFNMSATTSGGTAILCRSNANLLLKVRGATIVANFTNTEATKGRAIWVEKGEARIWNNNTIKLQGNGSVGIFFGADCKVGLCENNTIVYEPAEVAMNQYPVYYGIQTAKSVNLINNKVDLSNTPSNKRNGDYALYVEGGAEVRVIGDNSLYKVNTHANSSPVGIYGTAATVSLEGGVFTGPVAVTATSISGGKFSVRPDEKLLAKGYIFRQVGGSGVYKDYYTPVVDEGQVVASVGGEYYFNEADLWEEVFDGDEVTLYTTNPITVPAGKDITLNPHDPATVYNITNNGTIHVAWTTLLANMTNNGTIQIEGNGVYPESYYNSYVKGNVVDGNQIYYDADAKKYHVVRSNIEAIHGETAVTSISTAFRDVKDGESIVLLQDVSLSRSYYTVNGGKHITLNLNGHTLSGVYSKAALHIQNASLAVKNGAIKTSKLDAVAEGNSYCFFYLYGDTLNANAKDFSVLTIAEDVTVETPGTAIGVMYRQNGEKVYPQSYGVRVDIDGTIKGEAAISVSGVLTNTKGNVPVINISDKAKMNVTEGAVYAAGYAKWTYAGTINTDNFGVEVRAGEFTMDGGSIVSTATKPADDQFNGNGSTSQACGIAVCQHSTKLPINVVVNDGYIKAYTPLYQSNPQNNETDMKQINLTVNGGKFFSTSKNIVYSLNKRIVLKGGVYNMNPSAYAAEGKVVVANTDEATKDMYPYTIGDVKTGVIFQTEGEWSNADNWSAAATAETPVTIAANVTIGENVKAEAYGITVAEGKTITIQKGGMLVVGKQGIAGITSADQLVIEDGGYLLISPAATTNNQPLATVKKVLNIKHKDAGSYIEGVESPYLREHIGLPTVGKHTTVCDAQLLGRQWNTVSGWENISEFATAFKGYSLTSEVAPQSPAAFGGQLVGNQDAVLTMPRQGFHFVANSWTAPVSTMEVLNQVDKLKNEGAAEASVKIYLPAQAKFVDVNKGTLAIPTYQKWATLAPMQAFFLFANQPATVTLNYEQAVWNNSVAQLKAAPKRGTEEDNAAVLITVSAKNGRTDEVYVYEGEPFHSSKMPNEAPNINIYVDAENGNYSTFAAEDLDGTSLTLQTNDQTEYTLSFPYVNGETLGIKDMETGVVTAMTKENTYTFTAVANTTARRFTITRKDVPSSIDNTAVGMGAKGVYTVTGQFLGEKVDLNTLPQGIYVVDGQKYIK